ncbi:MAG: phosphate ABC transporter permease subunit PstC [Solirubrobacterales bacterium]
MSTATTVASQGGRPSRSRSGQARRRADRFGDLALLGVCIAAALLAAAALVLVAIEVVNGSSLAIDRFGLEFLTGTSWQPNPPFETFGAAPMIFGTAVTSFSALVLGVPIAVAIALFLSLLAPSGVRNVIGPLVEMLAAIPSVILGFWGILVLAPFVHEHVEPFLHDTLGFLPIFGEPQTTGSSIFTASLILTIMVIPIIASISRDLFLTVPPELKDGASALGATRWEMVRGVVLPTTASGVVAASILGLGRALGEAIAVTQVIGAGTHIKASLFETGDTLASRIAAQFPGNLGQLHASSLYYLGLILLVIGLASNVTAQWIGRRFSYQGAVAK